MQRNGEWWSRATFLMAATGLVLTAAGYWAIYYEREHLYLIPGRLAFYSGMALLVTAIVCWYRFVPPKPPAPEEVEHWQEDGEDLGSDETR